LLNRSTSGSPAPGDRPPLNSSIGASSFAAWYWLKSELQMFCRAEGLHTGGSKAELMQRVSSHLGGELAPLPVKRQSRKTAMPADLNIHTTIQAGWPLSHGLRDFFISQVGDAFRFNQALRDLFQNPQGQTLRQAVALYLQTRDQSLPIGAQFQFNQHMRDYFAQHPGATRAHALQAWREKRQTAGSLKSLAKT
jgi:hypothetical protein